MVGCGCLHEGSAHADRQVEVLEALAVALGVDELLDVRVLDRQHAHVSAPTLATLLDVLGGAIEDAHEGNRPRGRAARGGYSVSSRPEPREGEADPASGL